MSGSQRPVFASDDWMHEQQMRAELEAEAWRRLRRELAVPVTAPAPAQAIPAEVDPHRVGSAILKGLVRFALASVGAYLAFLAAVDSQLGEFEVWLAVGASFLVTLALTMFGPMRRFVHMLAETTRWMLLIAIGFGAVWMVTHYAV